MRSGKFLRAGGVALVTLGALGALLTAGLGSAQDRAAGLGTGFAGPPSFADVVEQVSPAVVKIAVIKQPVRISTAPGSQGFSGTPFDDFLERFGFGGQDFGGQEWNYSRPQAGEGSGFIVDAEGYIATNNHVVDGASEVMVRLSSGEELTATVVGTDPRTDLALIKVNNGGELPALELGDSDRARVGDWVLAIGNPFGLGGSATAGIISARGRDIQSGPYDDFLQIDAPINSGNSGGPVFNAAGEVIGINTAIISPTGGNVGIGLAIPSNQARGVIEELRTGGHVDRAWLGVEIQSVDARAIEALQADVDGGAMIGRVVDGGPADRAGLLPGDIVVGFDGQAVDSARVLSRLVGDLDEGDEVEIEIFRDGARQEVSTVLGALDESEIRAAAEPTERLERNFRYQWPETPRRR
ncbi:MAG: trypsin-like peptidase domain-containing protein [Gammaproteobacteria bacterium]|jgi:serine protease Do